MPRILKKRSEKLGLSPGSLVHVGEARAKAPQVVLTSYAPASLESRVLPADALCVVPPGLPTVTWVEVSGVSHLETIARLGDCFAIHPLVLEDIANTDQRPKAEEYRGCLYVVLKLLRPTADGVVSEQVSLVLGESWLLTFQEGLDGDQFAPVRQRLQNEAGRLRTSGPDYLAYALLDVIVDHYYVVLEQIGEEIELLEAGLIARPDRSTLRAIYRLKRELLFLHKSIWPLRELVSSLIRRESPLVREGTVVYLRDLYDHTVQVIDTLETMREMLGGMLDIYLSSASNRMNGIMQVLTVIATIFMPLTFIAGVYGMNFKHMPELEWPFGYPAVLLLMLSVAGGMLWFFRRRQWF